MMNTILIILGVILILGDLLVSVSLAAYKYIKGILPNYVIVGTIIQYIIGFLFIFAGYILTIINK